MKRFVVLVVAVISVPTVATAARVGPDAVWSPAPGAVEAIKADCADAKKVERCFAKGMREHGATRVAVRFAKKLPTFGWLRALVGMGPVDIAYVTYPFRANENAGALLVNGKPSIIDVDDQKLLPIDQLPLDPLYAKLQKKYPAISLWPDDRFTMGQPTMERLRQGGQWFAVNYRLRDGCRACQELATARFAFDFDTKGKFLGAKFIRVVPLQ